MKNAEPWTPRISAGELGAGIVAYAGLLLFCSYASGIMFIHPLVGLMTTIAGAGFMAVHFAARMGRRPRD